MPLVLQVALFKNLKILDYLPLDPLEWPPIGSRVLVPLKNQPEQLGIVIKIQHRSEVPVQKLKTVIRVLDAESLLTPRLQHLLHWMSDYYAVHLGLCYETALPPWLKKPEPMPLLAEALTQPFSATKDRSPAKAPQLTQAQTQVIEAILEKLGQYQAFLLYGITGSGKTEVYMRCIEAVLKRGQQVLVLVPEIGLTPQMLSRFENRFDCPIAVLHSRMSPKKRCENWLRAKRGQAQIILGTRSAVFTPLLNPGLFIVDEEHDLSFKQQDHVRYHAKDLLIMRAHTEACPIILGSATPSLESLSNALMTKKYQFLALHDRANQSNQPGVTVLDIRHKKLTGGLSNQLLQAISETLDRQEQVILFLNQRGFSPRLHCMNCHHVAQCKQCDVKLTYHQKKDHLLCHHCGYKTPYSTICPACNQDQLKPLGKGTERLEVILSEKFPNVPLSRVDKDTIDQPQKLKALMNVLIEGQPHILIGTQMLAKGHHFPKVTLVGIVDTDSAFFSQDFRSLERVAQLITQVAGRAGREHLPGHVYIQTTQPQNLQLNLLLSAGYLALGEMLLQERSALRLPPCTHQALLTLEGSSMKFCVAKLNQLKQHLQTKVQTQSYGWADCQILGPIPAAIAKKRNLYRMQLLLQTSTRYIRQRIVTELSQDYLVKNKNIKLSIDIDPMDFS